MSTLPPGRLALFRATGIELEYMIVDAGTLAVRPISDELIRSVTGDYRSDVERGAFGWSNELVLHVLEIKTAEPAPALNGLAAGFQSEVEEVNRQLGDGFGARLLPGAMHPWMQPDCETRLWPHEYSPVYEAYHRIFGCAGHGWSNLQSQHLNLPFADDDEFGRLHAAVRAVLPLMPGLAASSPIVEGRQTGWLDNRLDVYRANSARIPSITGQLVPEAVFSRDDYERRILQPMYADIAPFDPEGLLRHEFLNSRGAIARFGRGSIEIRVLDVQECPAADLAVAQLAVAAIRALAEERWANLGQLQALATDRLARVLIDCAREGERAVVEDAALLAVLGRDGDRPCPVSGLWSALVDELDMTARLDAAERDALAVILEQGTLARRIVNALGSDANRVRLEAVYARLGGCLAEGRPFLPRRALGHIEACS